MADNLAVTPGDGAHTACDEVTYSGETDAKVQLIRMVGVTGSEGSKTVTDVPSDATNGLLVNLGANNDITLATLPALVASSANIGDVDVLTLPALPTGTNNIGDVDVLTLPNVTLAAGTNTQEVVGDVAQDVAVAGNPVQIGWVASTAIPTAMAGDGRVVRPWANRNGAPVNCMAPHVGLNSDPWNLQSKTVNYTAAQTSAVVVAGGASEKLVVTQVQIQAYATTAGTAILYFGTGAYARGTNRAIFDGEFAPSATLKPGVIQQGPFIAGTNGDDVLFTSVGAISITITVWFYPLT